LHDALPILVGLSDEGLLTTQIMHRTTPSTLKILAPSAATPSPGLRPPSPHGRGSNKLQFTLPSPPSGEEDEGLISLHGVRGIASVVHHLGIRGSPLCPDGGEVKSSFATKTRTSTNKMVGVSPRP